MYNKAAMKEGQHHSVSTLDKSDTTNQTDLRACSRLMEKIEASHQSASCHRRLRERVGTMSKDWLQVLQGCKCGIALKCISKKIIAIPIAVSTSCTCKGLVTTYSIKQGPTCKRVPLLTYITSDVRASLRAI